MHMTYYIEIRQSQYYFITGRVTYQKKNSIWAMFYSFKFCLNAELIQDNLKAVRLKVSIIHIIQNKTRRI